MPAQGPIAAAARRPSGAPRRTVGGPAPRAAWLGGTLLLTLGALPTALLLAPAVGSAPGPALGGLLFLGSCAHVAGTGWFYAVPEVRRQLGARRGRYVTAPLALVAGSAVLAGSLPQRPFELLLLLPYFGWQFLHFQQQNRNLAGLASAAYGSGPLRRGERRALTAAGIAGICGLISHPALLRLADAPRLGAAFPLAAAGYALAVGYGVVQLTRRAPGDRRAAASGLYLMTLLFFLPVFLFQSPFTAVAALVLAHGFQYLLILGLVAGGGGGPRQARLASLAVLLAVCLGLGLLLDLASRLHTGAQALDRAGYGAYLGASMAHFVVDAGLWRPREEFPRGFLARRLPYLLG
ncbi:hypothetical protein GXW82_26280 [Streptacidiphilus sp. 4-A2]|nr:hypothetical protein [Streptacidiphilus sp. 4-A2]